VPQADLALILDIETTGNKEESELIEIGLVMLAVPSLSELGRMSVIVDPSPEAFSDMMANDVVRKMHEVDGLTEDLLAHKGVSKETADATINRWLDQFTDSPRTHIPYGGSGVAHFDRKYIDRDLPRLGKRLTYWALDVGSARRIFALQGASTMSIEGKTHRALDDALVHADELRWYAEAGTLADKYRDLQK
jgi:oligoribonuclease